MSSIKVVVNKTVRTFSVKYMGIKWMTQSGGGHVTSDNVSQAVDGFPVATPQSTDYIILGGKKKGLVSALITLAKNTFNSVFSPVDHNHDLTYQQKEAGKSLVANSEIARLLTLHNYDDNAVLTELAKKINRDETFTAVEIQLLISNLVDSSPATLDTLNEIAVALGNDPNFATTITTLIGTKEPAIPKSIGLLSYTGSAWAWVANTFAQASDLATHIADSVKHITALERTAWNGKLDATKAAIEGLLTGVISTHSHAADSTKSDKLLTKVTKTASFTLADTDSDIMILCDHATTPIVVTVPSTLAVGKQFYIKQKGVAAVSFVAGSGATIESSGSKLIINQRYAVAQIHVESATVNSLFGELK